MDIEGYGKVTLGFYPKAAPVTVPHLLSLFRLGCYDSNHIFRVDKGFVAQVQSVSQGSVLSPLSAECAREAAKTVPGEFTGIRHVRGMLSMGRMSDLDSGGSSCSRSRELTRAHPRLGPTRTAAAPPSPCCSAGRRISTASTPCLERCWTATTCSRASRRWRHARRQAPPGLSETARGERTPHPFWAHGKPLFPRGARRCPTRPLSRRSVRTTSGAANDPLATLAPFHPRLFSLYPRQAPSRAARHARGSL